MTSVLVKAVLFPLALAAPIAVAGAAWWSVRDTIDNGVPPESMRGELAGMEVER